MPRPKQDRQSEDKNGEFKANKRPRQVTISPKMMPYWEMIKVECKCSKDKDVLKVLIER